MNAVTLGLNKNKPFQIWGRTGYARNFFGHFNDLIRHVKHSAILADLYMGVKAENFIPPGFIKTGHHRQHDDEYGNAKGNAEQGK